MEALRDIIMGCLEEFFDEDDCPGDDERCPHVVDSELAMLAIIQGIREELAATKVTLRDFKKAYQDMEKRLSEVEKRKDFVPILTDPGLKDLLDASPKMPWEPRLVFTCTGKY